MLILQTERLYLRCWELEDADEGYEIWGNQEIMQYHPDSKVMSLDEVVLKITHAIEYQNKYGFQHWAVILKATETIIGSCGFNIYNDLDDESIIEIAFDFKKEYWGLGYASEAAEGSIAYAKSHFNIKTIEARVNINNIGSVKVLEKLNFHYKGLVYFDRLNRFEPVYELEL